MMNFAIIAFGFLLVLVGLQPLNVSIIYKFLTKKDSEMLGDEIDLNFIDYDKNYKKAQELSWYLLFIEACVMVLILLCIYAYQFDKTAFI